MALAQGTDLLLLDEPTTYLDVAHQMELLELLRDLNAGRGTTIVMVLHELNLAARFADHLVAMCEGRIVSAWPRPRCSPGDDARRVRVAAPRDPRTRVRHPSVVPLGRSTRKADR